MLDELRRNLLRRVLERACSQAQWCVAAGAPHSAAPGARAPDVFRAALSSERLEIEVSGVELSGWVTEDLQLAVQIRVKQPWSSAVEQALRHAIDVSPSLVARLVSNDWRLIRTLCRAKAAAHARAGLLAPRGRPGVS